MPLPSLSFLHSLGIFLFATLLATRTNSLYNRSVWWPGSRIGLKWLDNIRHAPARDSSNFGMDYWWGYVGRSFFRFANLECNNRVSVKCKIWSIEVVRKVVCI